MKILIFDDSEIHRTTAATQLAEHELTIIGDFDKAARELRLGKTTYDAVLTDLMVQTMDPDDLVKAGQEMPIGMALALLALKKGVKLVAIVTDANHHEHPGVHATDCLRGGISLIGESRFVCMQEAASQFDQTTMEEVDEITFLHSPEGKAKYPEIRTQDEEKTFLGYQGLVRRKRWDWALKALLEDAP